MIKKQNRCLFCWTICLWPQNTHQFAISLFHWSQIYFPGAFFWGLQTANRRWGPDLKNRVSAEAIRSAIHVVLPSLRSTCDTVNFFFFFFGERARFSFSFVGVFCQFLSSNASIMRYYIRYWWVFLSQGNQWRKYLAYSKIRRPKACLLMFASWVAFDAFYLLLSTQLTDYLTP